MTCKFTTESKIGLEPSIATTNPSLLIMGLQTIYLTNIAKKITNKAPKYHKGEVKII